MIFRTLYHVKSVIQGQCGVGLDVSSNIHFVKVELFYSPLHPTTTKDAGTNIAVSFKG